MEFDGLFRAALGGTPPFPYQRRFAVDPELPDSLIAPTGAGKTAALVLGWLYRRRFADPGVRKRTPRRLVLCLPMRTLVKQSADVCTQWLENLGLRERGTDLQRGNGVSVHVLMGGAHDEEWHVHPERDAVIIGTQDVLLSGALNRGYGISRFAWPWRHALLSNDVLWAFDEVQLMGAGLTTGLQLASFRKSLGAYGPTHSIFVSATLEPSWLRSVDHPQPGRALRLEEEDLGAPTLQRRRTATKRLTRASTQVGKGFERALAKEALTRHAPGFRTLVVLNTVDAAVSVHGELRKLAGGHVETALLHSRFRQPDRDVNLGRALAPGFDGIVISTQVIEAGVDISSRTLFTQLAPWPSLVQRAGRCNRQGELAEADVFWIEPEDIEQAPEPYSAMELVAARQVLGRLDSINPAAIEAAGVEMKINEPDHVLRRRDILDLFDTTPDLSGADIDVSRFIREGPEKDVQVFWRRLSATSIADQPTPEREELCAVPIGSLADALRSRKAYRWVAHEGEWRSVRTGDLFPGLVVMLDAEAGGYEPDRGWTPGSTAVVPPPWSADAEGAADELEEAYDADPLTANRRRWVSLREHAENARAAVEEVVREIDSEGIPGTLVALAAQVHDLGKAHPVFRASMQALGGAADQTWAKSNGQAPLRHGRRGFRHELASALAWLEAGSGPPEERDLVAYLLAAHHGKVRASIRALPTETPPTDGRLFARGIYDGDEMPEADLDGLVVPALCLSLNPMRLGRLDGKPSWTERVLRLRDRFGPFRLTFLEALVRVADVRASQREEA